jgi:hypothetical protein
MIGVHYLSHRTNLAVKTLYKMGIVGKIEDVLQSLYSYFFHNPKRIQNFVELVDIVEIGGQRIFRNIKTCWISMLLLTKSSQIYKLHGFIPNMCKIYYFISSYWLNTNVVHYLNTEDMCTIFMCKQHE